MKNKKLGVLVAFLAVILSIGITFTLAYPSQWKNLSIIGFGERTFTIGHIAYAAAGELDYVCDGVDDNVQFQAALNALPAGGGKLIALAGSYSFSATVTRAISNVTIEGVGRSTSFTYDTSTPIFTAGGNNWVFRDFITDAGGVNIGATTGWTKENLVEGSTFMALQVSGNITLDSSGRLGIGTTSPETKLHLADAGSLQLILQADIDNTNETDTASILFRRDGSTNALRIGVEGTDNQTFTGSLANTPYIQSVSSAYSIQFATDGELAMTVKTGGDVDIEDVLDVTNEIRIGTNGSQTDPGYTWTDDDNMGLFRAGIDELGFTTAGSEAVRIDSSGKVGIGTTSPSAVLDVANTDIDIAPELRLKRIDTSIEDTNALGAVYFTGTDGGSEAAPWIGAGIIAWAAESWATGDFGTDLDFYTADIGSSTLTRRMRIDSSGNIGIGTSTIPLDGFPNDFTAGGTLLEIGDGTKDSGITFRSRTSAGNAFDIWQDYSGINLYIDSRRDDDTSGIYFRTKTNGTPVNALTILSNGYIDMPGVYAETTASAANVFVASDGSLRRSTSSRELKENIDYEGIDPYLVLQFKPVSFDAKADGSHHLGFVAEDMRDIDPRLATSDDLPSLDTHAILAVLTAYVQELENRVTVLETQ